MANSKDKPKPVRLTPEELAEIERTRQARAAMQQDIRRYGGRGHSGGGRRVVR